jgi:hypothetical protein
MEGLSFSFVVAALPQPRMKETSSSALPQAIPAWQCGKHVFFIHSGSFAAGMNEIVSVALL